MTKDLMTDEQVEREIARLLDSDLVKLAKNEMRIKQRRRQYMYSLRTMERRGRQLESEGFTMDNIAGRLLGDLSDIDGVEEHER